jgi:RNA polymerase sigma-70 factor (ECF subfamily)
VDGGDKMIDDAELVTLLKNGAADAFDEVFRSYYKPIYMYVNRLVNDRALADDLTQEVLIKILRGLKGVDENKKLSPWIFRIAHNTCIDYYRKNKVGFELLDNINCNDSEINCPENIVLNKEMHNKIKEVLLKISQKYQEVLLLRVYKDLTYKEIASQLKLKESTVKTWIYKGRQQFQKMFAEVY